MARWACRYCGKELVEGLTDFCDAVCRANYGWNSEWIEFPDVDNVRQRKKDIIRYRSYDGGVEYWTLGLQRSCVTRMTMTEFEKLMGRV